MNIGELIVKLQEKQKEVGNITVCVYDSVFEDYTSCLSFEVVEDDHYQDCNGITKEEKKILLL